MRHSETVTFGGSGLDRAAELRTDARTMQAALRAPEARAILLWRGKPLIAGADGDRLVRLPLHHPVLAAQGGAPIHLGREEDGHCFAVDLADWQPADLDAAAMAQFFDPTRQAHPDLPPDHAFVELRGVMTRLSPRDAELAATARAVLNWHDMHRHCGRCGSESAMSAGGWQRDCKACGTKHFPRTDPVVIMAITRGNAVLMGRSPAWPEGMYSLLAGFVEPGESIEAAVRREVMEEAGISVGAVRYLASQPWPYPASLMMGCHGEALSGEITIDPAEIEDALWVTREEMMQVFAGQHPRIRPPRNGAIAHFIMRNWLADRLN